MKFQSQFFIAAALFSAVILVASAADAPQRQALKGHVPKITRKLSPQGRLDANRPLQIAIGLPLRNREQLTNLLADIYNPSSPNFRHFLKADEFAATFGPSEGDYQKVIDFAKAHGLIVKHTHPNRTLLDVEGAVADVENAFHVHMMVYPHPTEARTFFAPDVEPSLDLDTPVLVINGLDNYVKPRPHIHVANASPKIRPLRGPGGGGGGGGPFEGYDFLDAYAPNVEQDGTGQSVGLFELFGFNPDDVTDYEDDANIIPYVTVQAVSVDGGDTSDDVDYDTYCEFIDYAVETAGDIEMALSMAPGLNSVRVYIGPTPLDQPPLGSTYIQDATTTAQINDVFNSMATDANLCRQLSCSYGMDINLSTVQIFQQFAAQGQSLFIASGDFGAFSSAYDEPADDPYATIVGGTTLTTNSSAGWQSEITWTGPAGTDLCDKNVPPQASAGGISTVYSIPSWQQGISMTANQGSTTMRNLPDVSLVADNITVFWGNTLFGLGEEGGGNSLPLQVGGTSLATPLWAGFIALVNEQAAATGRPPIGFANPALYAIAKSINYASCFHDITTGANTNSASPTKYSASTGYDLCTGWGSMNGDNLLPALLAPPADNLLIISSLGFTSQGRSGGPFSVTSQTSSLTNTGAMPLTWSLVNTSSWLTVSSAGGVLNPGASTTVTVSLNANANKFLVTHASGNIVFNNLTAGTSQNRQFDLYVGNGGFETGDFTDWTYAGDPAVSFVLADDDSDIAGQPAFDASQPDKLFVHSGIYGAYLGNDADTGKLSQTVPTLAGQPLLISFWVTPVSDDTNAFPTNVFAAKWNGSTFFVQTNLTAVWTNIQSIVSSAGASGTLEFDFNNVPGAFGFDDVTVQTVPAPVLSSTMVSSGNINFNWSAFVNVSYQIQSAANLTGGWTNVGSSILATNMVMSISLPMAGPPGRFYRVAISP